MSTFQLPNEHTSEPAQQPPDKPQTYVEKVLEYVVQYGPIRERDGLSAANVIAEALGSDPTVTRQTVNRLKKSRNVERVLQGNRMVEITALDPELKQAPPVPKKKITSIAPSPPSVNIKPKLSSAALRQAVMELPIPERLMFAGWIVDQTAGQMDELRKQFG